MEDEKILIKDIPLLVTLGELGVNIQKAHKIMIAITERRYHDAFNIASEILNENDAIIESQVNKDEIMKILNREDEIRDLLNSIKQ